MLQYSCQFYYLGNEKKTYDVYCIFFLTEFED